MYLTDEKTFDALVDEGIAAIPQQFRDKFDNLSFVVYDFPSPHQLQKMQIRSPFGLLGLYEGVPITNRGSSYAWVLPDKISLFKRPMEVIASSEEHLRTIVKNTIWHEVAHHFGMDEEKVRSLEKRRGHIY